jgi:hypothetical protein
MTSSNQADFAYALRDRDVGTPAGLRSHTGATPDLRFAVYRNNVHVGLKSALVTRFPATEAIVGSEFFSAVAAEFILHHPPVSPVLLSYGDAFAEFIERFPPLADLPYLADVVRLEAARSRAYHAADRAPLHPDALARLPADNLAAVTLVLHPSATVIRSSHPVVTVWAMNAGEEPLLLIADWRGEDALVIRPELTVRVHRLPYGAADFIEALSAGAPLGDAARASLTTLGAFDLAETLACLLSAGLFTDAFYPEKIHA